jgi:hypothetical protein
MKKKKSLKQEANGRLGRGRQSVPAPPLPCMKGAPGATALPSPQIAPRPHSGPHSGWLGPFP